MLVSQPTPREHSSLPPGSRIVKLWQLLALRGKPRVVIPDPESGRIAPLSPSNAFLAACLEESSELQLFLPPPPRRVVNATGVEWETARLGVRSGAVWCLFLWIIPLRLSSGSSHS